jgi:hypothetical protein
MQPVDDPLDELRGWRDAKRARDEGRWAKRGDPPKRCLDLPAWSLATPTGPFTTRIAGGTNESIEELRQIADGRNDILAKAARTTAGSRLPRDYDQLERWTRVGCERGMRSRKRAVNPAEPTKKPRRALAHQRGSCVWGVALSQRSQGWRPRLQVVRSAVYPALYGSNIHPNLFAQVDGR